MATSTIKNNGLKKASTWAEAVANGTEIIVTAVGTAGSNPIGLSVTIPVAELSSTSRLWLSGASYNGQAFEYLQVGASLTSYDPRLYHGANIITSTKSIYYR